MHFLLASGIIGLPLAVLTLVILGLIVRAAVRIRRDEIGSTLFAILFWGFAAAVLGFLGQCAGLYNALTVIAGADEISPRVISRGFAESFSTTLWGGGLLVVAGLAWFALRGWRRLVAGRPARG